MVPPYIGHTLSKVWVICVLVSQVFVFFGVFSTELLTLPCKITEVGRLSLFIEFFVGFHIVCDRYTLDNAHFTYFNTIWPLSLSSTFGTAFITGSHIVSYVTLKETSNYPAGAQRAERSRRDLSALWASRRASAQAVTSKWHFRTTSPINTPSPAGENWFSAKIGRSGAVFSSIRTIPRGQTTEISVRTQPSIRFFPLPTRNGPFRPFFGPQGAQMERSLLVPHPEGAMHRASRVHPSYPFPI